MLAVRLDNECEEGGIVCLTVRDDLFRDDNACNDDEPNAYEGTTGESRVFLLRSRNGLLRRTRSLRRNT